MLTINWLIESGWQDSNLRPPRPKRGAITGLRYTPKMVGKYTIKSLSKVFFSDSSISLC